MTLVDSNVLLDVLRDDPIWRSWSLAQLDTASVGGFHVNAIVYAEIAPAFADPDAADEFLNRSNISLQPLSTAALFKAGLAHRRYRQRSGRSERVLPDFMIGAQAEVCGWAILTRDPRRYRTYFPSVPLIAP